MLKALNLSAAALALLTSLPWGPPALAAARVSAVCGVAAGDSITVGGSISIICTPRELLELVHAQQAFRDAQSERIRQIATDLSLSSCEAEELLKAVAKESPRPGAAAEQLMRLAAERRGHSAQWRDIVRRSGVATSKGSVDAPANLIVGIPPEELDDLIQHVRNVDERYLARLEELASDLGFSRCAMANFLATLGQKTVPPEQLSGKLTEIANAHLKLVHSLRALTTPDPLLEKLRAQAVAALESGDYQTAELVLEEAEKILAEKGVVSPMLRDKAKIVAARGDLELAQLRYTPAAELFKRAASHAVTADSPPEQVRYLLLAGGAYQDAGLYNDAQSIYKEALKWGEANPNQVSAETIVTTLNNIGGLHFAQSDPVNAIRRFEQALSAAWCAADLDVEARVSMEATSRSGLASAKVTINDFDSAEYHFAQALSLMELLDGSDSATLVPILTNWAWLETNRGEYKPAEALYLRAVLINDSRDTTGALEAAATKNNLAGLYDKLGRRSEAENLWTAVKAVFESQLGADHQATLAVSLNLANALRQKGDLAEAERAYDHLLAAWEEKVTGEDKQVDKSHLVIASLHAALGDLYVKQNRLREAKKRYDKAIAMAESQLGDERTAEESLAIAGFENDRAVVYQKEGDLEDAVADLERARSKMAANLGVDHPDYGTTTNNLAGVFMRLGRLEDAVPLYLAAIAVAERARRPPVVASRSRSLAAVYKGLGNLPEARRHLQTTKGIYQGLGPEYAEQLAAVEQQLVELDKGLEP